MYTGFFGLKEPGFAITPDPQYLYLSPQHREALAHLLYGVGDGGGFVQLTGEVGTGKTTICRALLDQLPQAVDVALVLNPALTSAELLRMVCREFGVEAPADESSAEEWVNRLNQYLLRAHAEGRRPVLVIDEAQNLSPQVLEQVRLLTNLETAKHKLLQIFLIGQPELREVLRQPGLRQVAQRITARYHLLPLNRRETRDYIRHRLAVAGADRNPFTRRAMTRIHRRTGGVPRLINILCDRTLLGAYALDRRTVGPFIVERAARELAGERGFERTWPAWPIWLSGVVIMVLVAVVGWWHYGENAVDLGLWSRLTALSEVIHPASQATPSDATTPAVVVVPVDHREIPNPVAAGGLVWPEPRAMEQLLKLWGVSEPLPGVAGPCAEAEALGLICRDFKGTWNALRRYDLPALLPLTEGAGYAVLSRLREDKARLETPGGALEIPITALDRVWLGDFRLVWRLAPGGVRLIGPRSSPESITWLRNMLNQSMGGATEMGADPAVFDESLRGQLIRFQESRGLTPDGVAGPETLMRLLATSHTESVPRLGAP
jgi:general secretion pathway protein A